MSIYVDADLFIAVLKDEDHLKHSAVDFFNNHAKTGLVTSTMTLIEVWFLLNRHKYPNIREALQSVRELVSDILPVTDADLQAAVQLSAQYSLSPADSIHAVKSFSTDAIASSDKSYDRIKGLKRIRI